jgi:membrane protease subunit (stomatin/prohibitin family)
MLMLAVGHQMGKAQAQQQMQAQAQQQAATAQAQATAPATKDTAAELQKLADLHKQGVLTDEEFAAMKKKLLGL